MVSHSSTDHRLDQARHESLSEWEAMAPGWERRREFLRDFSQGITDWLIAALDPQPGQTILELAAGPGDTGFAAARLIGETGRLISTDFAPGMVEVSKRRAKELGVSNVQFDVLDAERNALDTNSVDGVLCRWGYMLMPDPAAAIAESRRVLCPGGRLALTAMGRPENNPWASLVAKSIFDLGLVPPMDPNAPGGLFSLADHDKLRDLLVGADFDNVRIEDVEFHLSFSDFEEYWRFILEFAGAVAVLLQSFSDQDRARVHDTTKAATKAFLRDVGYDFPGLAVNAVAS